MAIQYSGDSVAGKVPLIYLGRSTTTTLIIYAVKMLKLSKTTEHEQPLFDNAARHINSETTSISRYDQPISSPTWVHAALRTVCQNCRTP